MARRESILFELAVEYRKDLEPEAVRASSRPLSRRYVGEAGRQIHLTEGGRSSVPGPSQPPLACFHGAPSSGAAFTPFLTAMAERRHVLALDIPGYGASDRPEQRLDIAGYAEIMGKALEGAFAGDTLRGGDRRIDLFGHATGALIAAELARQRPDRVRRLVLMSVPYFVGAEQAVWRHRLRRRDCVRRGASAGADPEPRQHPGPGVAPRRLRPAQRASGRPALAP